jgi:hypothetical protein
MSRHHQANRRRIYGRRQHDLHEQPERCIRVASWVAEADPFETRYAAGSDLLGRRAAEAWLHIIGLD